MDFRSFSTLVHVIALMICFDVKEKVRESVLEAVPVWPVEQNILVLINTGVPF